MAKCTAAKLFMNGRSQAVRLPREFRFAGDEVRNHKRPSAPNRAEGYPHHKPQLCQRNSCAFRCEPRLSFTFTSAGPLKFIASSSAPRRYLGSST